MFTSPFFFFILIRLLDGSKPIVIVQIYPNILEPNQSQDSLNLGRTLTHQTLPVEKDSTSGLQPLIVIPCFRFLFDVDTVGPLGHGQVRCLTPMGIQVISESNH